LNQKTGQSTGKDIMSDNGNIISEEGCKADGIYLFCFARRDGLLFLNITGLDEQYPVYQWAYKDIIAVLCRLSLEEFCGAASETRMKDLSWIGPRACRHEEVVEHVMRHSPVLPARFGTIFSSLKRLEALLEIHYRTIVRFLEQVDEKDEWSVKGLIDRAKVKESFTAAILTREEDRRASLSPGKRYLIEKRIRSVAEKESSIWLKGVIEGLGNDLRRQVPYFCERRIVALDREDMNPILNWAFLVPRDTADSFRTRVDQANADHARQGLLFQLSGPWPPYSFCPSLEVE
jgi:hypothetical protein